MIHLPVTEFRSRKILILGSSTAAGTGATRYSRSWAGLFTSEMNRRGFTVENRSIGGTGTEYSNARIDDLLVQIEPDFVLLTTSIANEGFVENPARAKATFLRNLRTLIDKSIAKSVIPIVAKQYPSLEYTDTHMEVLRSLNSELEFVGVPLIGMDVPLLDSENRVAREYFADSYHPNDQGHLELARSIPNTYFEGLNVHDRNLRQRLWDAQLPEQGWTLESSKGSSASISLNPDDPVFKWTLNLNLNRVVQNRGREPNPPLSDTTAVNMLKIVAVDEDDDTTEISFDGSSFRVDASEAGSGSARLVYSSAPAGWRGGRRLVSIKKVTRFLIVSSIDQESNQIDQLTIPFRDITVKSFKVTLADPSVALTDITLHRIGLPDSYLVRQAQGSISRASLDLWLPLRQMPSLSPTNFAHTSSTATAEDHWVPGVLLGGCVNDAPGVLVERTDKAARP